jgi:peptide-methionine (S)-S-oxide reductase
MWLRSKPDMVTAEQRPGGPVHPDPGAAEARGAGHPDDPAVCPEDAEVLYVGMGCFWGAERIFWQIPAW